MANEHVKIAASNLQRAAQDARQKIKELNKEIDDSRRQAASSISNLRTQIGVLQHGMTRPETDTNTKVASQAEMSNINLQIGQIKKDNDEYVRNLQNQINALNSEVNEFNSLSSHLNQVA